MQKTRRYQSLPPCSFSEIARNPSLLELKLSERVKNWLACHGFSLAAVNQIHSKPNPRSSFVEIDGCFLCPQTGDVHLCDESCQKRLQSLNQSYCPISGFATTLDFGRNEQSDDDNEEEDKDFSGRLGRAFADGYGCSDDAEFSKLWNLH